MKVFDHKDLGNHLLQLCPKVVKHPVYSIFSIAVNISSEFLLKVIFLILRIWVVLIVVDVGLQRYLSAEQVEQVIRPVCL